MMTFQKTISWKWRTYSFFIIPCFNEMRTNSRYCFYYWGEQSNINYQCKKGNSVVFDTDLCLESVLRSTYFSQTKVSIFLEIKLFVKIKRNGSIEFFMEDDWLNFVKFWIICIICKTCSFLGLFNIHVPSKLTILFTWWGILCRQLR